MDASILTIGRMQPQRSTYHLNITHPKPLLTLNRVLSEGCRPQQSYLCWYEQLSLLYHTCFRVMMLASVICCP